MKTEPKSKLLWGLIRCKKNNEGFTMVELLVVIIILSVLAAMALPTYLNQAAKARQAEAKQTLGALLRSQQAYRLEHGAFSKDIGDLGIGVGSETQNYRYQSKADSTGASGEFSDDAKTFSKFAEIFGVAKDALTVKSYAGGVGTSEDEVGNTTSITLLCESNKPTGQPDGVTAETAYTAKSGAAAATIGCGGTDSTL